MNYASVQILEKFADSIVLSWDTDPSASVSAFQLYVTMDPASDAIGSVSSGYVAVQKLTPDGTALAGAWYISNAPSGYGIASRSVVAPISEAQLQKLGGRYANIDVQRTPLYFRAITLNSSHVLSTFAGALTKATQAGLSAITGRLGTQGGASYVSNNGLYDDNYTVERTFGVSGVLATELIYMNGGSTGAHAKLITYTGPFYDGRATKMVVSDTIL